MFLYQTMFEEDIGSNDSGDIEALPSLLDWEEHEEKALTSTVEATKIALSQREHQKNPRTDQLGANKNECITSFEQYSRDIVEMQRKTNQMFNVPQAQPRDRSLIPSSATTAVLAASSTSKKQEPKTESDINKNLISEEKMKIVRDRNREHARNTRLQKKQYLEELKKIRHNVAKRT